MKSKEALVLLLLLDVVTGSSVKHVVVLMMENRSFDHLLGFLHEMNPKICGLDGSESNPEDPSNPKSPVVKVNKNGYDVSPDDPGHSLDATTEQIYGYAKPNGKEGTPKMNGFVKQALEEKHSKLNPMSMFTSTSAPIINTLATEFAVFDKWYAAIPGPTDVNRAMAMSGTSASMTTNFNKTLWTQQSHFDFLRERNVSFSAYYQDDPWAVMYFADMQKAVNHEHVHELAQFYKDLDAGHLASYTWLQPRMTSHKGMPTWQHPDASVREGERLIKSVYEALRNSKFWDDLVFVLTYDEHGGFYDHVAPPQTGVPSPDGRISKEGFKFERLGLRLPTVVISPLIPKGTVVHEPTGPTSTSQFDSTSLIATANKIFGIEEHMTHRDAWAGTYEGVMSLTEPRTDCPTKLPDLPAATTADLAAQRARPVNDHLQTQIEFYCHHNNRGVSCGEGIRDQGEASVFLEGEIQYFLSNLESAHE